MFKTGDGVEGNSSLPNLTSINTKTKGLKNINTVRNSMVMITDPNFPGKS